MSIGSASAFVNKMKSDKDFATLVSEAGSKQERWNILNAAGFNFSKDEFENAYDESNDEALLASVGGNVLRSRECVCCKC